MALLWIASVGMAMAHEIRPAIVDLNYASMPENDTGSTQLAADLTIDISLNLESLISEIGPDHEDTDDSENSELYENLRAMGSDQLREEFDLFKESFLSSVMITDLDGSVLPLRVVSIAIPPAGDKEIPRDTLLTLSTTLPENDKALRWQWSESYGEAIVRANSDAIDTDFAVLLSPGQQSEPITFDRATKPSAGSVIANYIVVGFEHILPKGLDHILFVVGLFLLAPRFRPLAVQITTFTIAHSITLALGITGYLVVSASIVEPLIALSIVFVCVENFLTDRLNKWRIAIVFIFGLLHGLGFASVLGEVGLAPGQFATALFGFNIGVEIGQLVVVAICLLLVGVWFGNKPWYRRRITQPASIVVGLIGVYWFLERTVL